MSTSEDPRAIRTKEMLQSALLRLFQQGYSVHEISVSKLTKEAKLNRTTFYLHFNHIEDLKNYLMEQFVIELDRKFEVLSNELTTNRENQLQQLLTYLQQQRFQLLCILKTEQLEQLLFRYMKEVIIERRNYSAQRTRRSLVDPDIKTASIVGIIMWWLKSAHDIDSQHIAQQIHLMYRA